MVPAADGMAPEFPGWHIWRSQAGRWWATRLGHVAWDQHHDLGFAMTVDADTPAELMMVLARQPQVPADPVRRPRPNTRSSPNTRRLRAADCCQGT